MASEHLRVAERAIAAYNRGDLAALLELMTEDVVATVPVGLGGAGTYQGHDAFVRMLREWEEAWGLSGSTWRAFATGSCRPGASARRARRRSSRPAGPSARKA